MNANILLSYWFTVSPVCKCGHFILHIPSCKENKLLSTLLTVLGSTAIESASAVTDKRSTRGIFFNYQPVVVRWNEKIHIACLDEDGEPVRECEWRVPRRLLTDVFLQNACMKCPLSVKVSQRIQNVRMP